HDEKSIIGHIIASRCLAADGSEIVSDTHPDYFDIEVDFVLYKEIFPDIATNIAKKGPEKKQFVSMECILSGFDYGLIDASNNLTIVKRNKDTAFLTKYLRVYNGSGMYKEYRIGRVLRDFV